MMQLLSTDIHHMWLPKGEPRAVVICVHGIGLHGGCYDCLGKTLSQNGLAVLAIDVRGYGCWRQWGDHQLDIRGSILDLQRALQELRNLYPGKPLFLAGESMGAAIALKCASLDESLIDGLILSAPAIDASKHYFNLWELWLKYYFRKNSRVSLLKSVIERSEEDEFMRNVWLNDYLACKEVYVRDLVAIRNLIRDNQQSARRITKVPALVLQGYKDRLFYPRRTIELFEQMATHQKELVYIGDAQHLMLQSGKQDHRCASVVLGWMEIIIAKLACRDMAAFPAPYCEFRLVQSYLDAQQKRLQQQPVGPQLVERLVHQPQLQQQQQQQQQQRDRRAA